MQLKFCAVALIPPHVAGLGPTGSRIDTALCSFILLAQTQVHPDLLASCHPTWSDLI